METAGVIKKIVAAALSLCLFICSGCVSMLRYDGPYKGRVIDAQTGQPVEGAVAHGTWSRIHFVPTGSSSEYYDSYEMLTDKNGEFKIPGQGLLVLSNIDDMSLTIFKAGYKQWRPNNWSGLRDWKSDDSLTWDESGVGTFKMRKMTLEERRQRGVTMPFGPSKSQKLLRRECNKENIEIGRPSTTLYKED